jgi:hypothetical protein
VLGLCTDRCRADRRIRDTELSDTRVVLRTAAIGLALEQAFAGVEPARREDVQSNPIRIDASIAIA